jgi:hypothetical protein
MAAQKRLENRRPLSAVDLHQQTQSTVELIVDPALTSFLNSGGGHAVRQPKFIRPE